MPVPYTRLMVSEFGSRLQHYKYTLYQSSYITQNFGGFDMYMEKKQTKKTLSAITLQSPSTHCSSDVAAPTILYNNLKRALTTVC